MRVDSLVIAGCSSLFSGFTTRGCVPPPLCPQLPAGTPTQTLHRAAALSPSVRLGRSLIH